VVFSIQPYHRPLSIREMGGKFGNSWVWEPREGRVVHVEIVGKKMRVTVDPRWVRVRRKRMQALGHP